MTAHLVHPPVGKLELGADEIAPTHQDEQAQELDGFEGRSFKADLDASKFAAVEVGQLSTAEDENGSVKYAILEGDIVYADTLRPVVFACDLHPHVLTSSCAGAVMTGARSESIDQIGGTEA